MGRYFWLLAVIASLVLPTARAVGAETGDRVVTGRVRNGTPGGEAIGSIEVTLKNFEKDKETGASSARTDASGFFRFSNVPHTSGQMHSVSARYRDVEYIAQAFTIADNEETKDVEVLVFELTDSDKAIRVERTHTVIDIDPESQSILVLEYSILVNDGDRTVSGAKTDADGGLSTLRFSVPPGAQDPQARFGRDDLDLQPTTGAVTANAPVRPGATDATLAYRLPYQSSDYVIARSSRYPTNTADVFVGDVGASANVKGLTSKGPLDADKRRYLYFSGQDVAADTDLTINLSNLPVKSPYPVWLWPTLAVLPVGAALAFVYISLKGRTGGGRGTPVPARAFTAPSSSQRRHLIEQLAELDDRFETGAIPETEYRALRLQKKAQLMALARRGQPAGQGKE